METKKSGARTTQSGRALRAGVFGVGALAALGVIVVIVASSVSAVGLSRAAPSSNVLLTGAAATATDLYAHTGIQITQGAIVRSDGLLPLTVRPAGVASKVKFTLDGVYLGTATTAPFSPAISSLGPGAHKLRYTIVSNDSSKKRTVEFVVVSTTPTPSSPAPSSGSAGAGVVVGDAVGLQAALDRAVPGMTITLRDGEYNGGEVSRPGGREPGRFVIAVSGTAGAPITLRGSAAARLNGAGIGAAYAVHLVGADWWKLEGFTVRSASKGVVLDHSGHNTLTGLHVTDIGQEGVHFRAFSSDNTITASVVDNTGLTSPNFGEGVYVGSAVSNWAAYSAGQPDRSDRNQVLDNHIADTAAENIDIKEGSAGGVIRGNDLGGDKIAGKNSADSWIDVKGNGYLVQANRGHTAAKPGTTECGDPKGAAGSPKNPFCDGIQVHVQVPGWGADNTFTDNVLQVNAPGVGIWIQNTAVTQNNIIRCDNAVTAAKSGNYATNHYTPLTCTA